MTATVGRWALVVALIFTMGALTACDRLLSVNLPTAVTSGAFDNPGTADIQVNSVMALVECGYSGLALDASGNEDNFERYSGSAGSYEEYNDTPVGGECDPDNPYSHQWVDAMLTARAEGYNTYDRIGNWTDAEVSDREKLLAEDALYTAVALDVFGEYFCDFAIDAGPMMTPDMTLDTAAVWVDRALSHIGNTGDFAIDVQNGEVTPSIEQMAHGLKARILWAKGDLSGAAAEAAQVEDGFYSYILRETGAKRRNMVSVMQGGGGGTQAGGFLQGAVKLKTADNDYGVSLLGNKPNGEPWPDVVPFTGYLNLAIGPDGRAVDADGYPITTDAAGSVADVRVPYTIGNTAGGPDNIIQKYVSESDDIPLVSWVEMRLIQAEAEGGAAAVGYVNQVRHGSVYIGGSLQQIDLPDVTYNPTGDQVEDMIIEERRRALWLEGRYWATKIQHPNKLWFPRKIGDWVNQAASYVLNGGVRVLMPEDEYQINPNLTLADRATACPADQAPVYQ